MKLNKNSIRVEEADKEVVLFLHNGARDIYVGHVSTTTRFADAKELKNIVEAIQELLPEPK